MDEVYAVKSEPGESGPSHGTEGILLQHAIEKWHKLFEILPVGVAIVDVHNGIVDCNSALAKILRISREALLQGAYKNWRYFNSEHSPLSAEDFPSFRAIKEKKTIRDVEVGLATESGDVIWLLVSAAPLASHPDRCVVATADISERKRAESTLRESADAIEDLYNHAPCGYHSLDSDGVICRINDTELGWLGYTRDEAVGKLSYRDLLTPASREAFLSAFPLFKQQGVIRDFEVDILRKDGTEFSGLVNATAIYDANGKFLCSRSTIVDITERKRVELQLRQLAGHMRQLAGHIQSVLEEEKIQIAREIHDDLGGTLTTMKMEAYWLKSELSAMRGNGNDESGLLDHVREMSQLIDAAMGKTRHIITGLRPTILDDLGIVAALEWLAEQFQKRTSIECRVNCVCDYCEECKVKLDKPLSIALFRIAQEALTNVARHSGASRVEIEFHCSDEESVMSVIDNGRGITGNGTNGTMHFGLLGMRERANLLGGRLILDPPPGGGFNVTVVLPMAGHKATQEEMA